MPGTFLAGTTLLNGSAVDLPVLYSNNITGGLPPYTVSENANVGKYINTLVTNGYASQGVVTRSGSSLLWFKRSGEMLEPWKSIVNNNDETTIITVTFANGNYVNFNYEKNTPGFRANAYLKNGTLIAQPQYLWQGDVMRLPQFTDIAIAVMTDGDTRFGAIITLENGTGYNRIQIGRFLQGFSNNRANELIFSNINPLVDPYETSPDSIPGGGFGDFDYSGDSILPPELPTISVADSGFVTLYAPTIGQIQSLASYMWSGLFDIATFRKLFADPMDCIISLNIVPVDLPAGSAQELKVGNIGTGQQINVLSAQFIKIKFATKNIGIRTNSFMDYSPYVKAQIFLPFIGTRSLSIDDIANADVTVEYHIDLFSGACTAYIICKKNNSDGSELKSALYEFSGNICANIPFTATNYNSFLSSLLGTAAAVTTAIATQGSSSAVAGALSSGIDTATAIKPDVERSGNMSATNGFLGIQKPFLIITYPNVCKPACRDKTVGTPSFIGLSSSKKLSSFHKLTKLHRINVKGIPCTEQERQLIIDQLTGEGVIMP